MSGAEKFHCSSVVRSSQFTVRDVGREGSEVSCEGAELESFRGSWSKLRSMLSEPDASRSGKSGLVSSSMRRYLKLVIGSVHLCEVIRQLNWGLLQKTQIRKMLRFPVVARTPFWSFCAGQKRVDPGQITDGT